MSATLTEHRPQELPELFGALDLVGVGEGVLEELRVLVSLVVEGLPRGDLEGEVELLRQGLHGGVDDVVLAPPCLCGYQDAGAEWSPVGQRLQLGAESHQQGELESLLVTPYLMHRGRRLAKPSEYTRGEEGVDLLLSGGDLLPVLLSLLGGLSLRLLHHGLCHLSHDAFLFGLHTVVEPALLQSLNPLDHDIGGRIPEGVPLDPRKQRNDVLEGVRELLAWTTLDLGCQLSLDVEHVLRCGHETVEVLGGLLRSVVREGVGDVLCGLAVRWMANPRTWEELPAPCACCFLAALVVVGQDVDSGVFRNDLPQLPALGIGKVRPADGDRAPVRCRDRQGVDVAFDDEDLATKRAGNKQWPVPTRELLGLLARLRVHLGQRDVELPRQIQSRLDGTVDHLLGGPHVDHVTVEATSVTVDVVLVDMHRGVLLRMAHAKRLALPIRLDQSLDRDSPSHDLEDRCGSAFARVRCNHTFLGPWLSPDHCLSRAFRLLAVEGDFIPPNTDKARDLPIFLDKFLESWYSYRMSATSQRCGLMKEYLHDASIFNERIIT